MKSNYNFNSMGTYKPVSEVSSLSYSPQQIPRHQHQQQTGRHLSAILDDNNTVICYLEPMPK